MGYPYLLEVGANSDDLVDEILNGEDVVLAESFLDDSVVGKGNTLLVDLAVTALVDKFADGLEVGLAGKKKKQSAPHPARTFHHTYPYVT